MEGFLSTGTLLREKFALPISDSTFPHWIFNQGLVAEEEHEPVFPDFGVGERFDFANFLDNCGPWLRQAYRGRVDTVHGWLLRQMIRIGNDVVVGNDGVQSAPLRLREKLLHPNSKLGKIIKRTTEELPPSAHRIYFRLPEGWHPRVPPRYFVFHLRAPTTGYDAKLAFLDGETTIAEVDLTELRAASPETLLPYVLDLHAHVSRDVEVLKRLDVEVRLVNKPSFLEIRDPMMISWMRDDIAEQMDLFNALNIRLNTYTSHGGGYNIGLYRADVLEAADKRGMADCPDNPYFALDLFAEFGLRFYNTANNTSRRSPVRLSEFLLPKTLNNGDTVYDFHRFNHVPTDSNGKLDFSVFEMFGKVQNPSMANFAGWQIVSLIEHIKAADGVDIGGVIYTHLLSKSKDDPNRRDRSFNGLFNQETSEALLRLTSSYYGLSGGQDVGKPDPRIFVAPQAALLRYAQVSAGLTDAASYDVAENTVHVSNWNDGVTKEILPRDIGGGNALRFATFYVRDAATARLLVDGVEHTALIRNGPDTSGRQSITVADAGSPTVILGRVAIDERPDRASKCSGCELQSLKGDQGHIVEINNADAVVTIRTRNLTLADQSGIRPILTGDLTGISWALSIHGERGQELKFVVGDKEMAPAHVHVVCGTRHVSRQEVVVPLYQMTETANTAEPPGWPVKEIVLQIYGAAGRTIHIERLDFLRDDPRVYTPDCMIGGRADPTLELAKVVMLYGDRTYRTHLTDDGWYVFLDRVPRGEIVRLHGERADGSVAAFPVTGPEYEVTTDSLEVDFRHQDPIA